jgi:hypothetical protein
MACETAYLSPGDLIQIRYRLGRHFGSMEETCVEVWITAEVIACDLDARPLVRLADGQITEVRRFMPWRFAPGYEPGSERLAA